MLKKTILISIVSFLFVGAAISSFAKKNSQIKTDRRINKDMPFNFFVMGDWGRRGNHQQQIVADQMIIKAKNFDPDFILTVGDNFYEDGVTDIHDKHWDQSFNNVYRELTTDYTWYITLGNHDYRGKPEAQIAYHNVNPHWNLPDRYYTVVLETPDHEKVRLVVIDTSPLYNDYYSQNNMPEIKMQDTAKQYRWIDSVLANSTEEWKFVIGHHPVYSGSPTHGNTIELVNRLKPMLDKYKVQAYICGHDHDMQHIKPEGSEVDYFISGSASEAKETGTMIGTKFSSNTLGFSDFLIKNDSLFVNYFDTAGKVVYHYVRKK